MSEMMKWPYPIRYGVTNEVSTDVLILGGGVAGCWAAITAARKGVKVAMVEKGATIRSGGGGAGCDHWQFAVTNPACKIGPEEFTEALVENHGGYSIGIHRYIQSREAYDTLLELERMGVKIRDSENEFKGAAFRDEKTKFLFAYDYESKYTMLIWGTMIKPVLYNECKRLGVDIYDRVYVSSLLTEGSKQGARVLGATGVNVRTGEFYVFQGKATVCCLAYPESVWIFSTEYEGLGWQHRSSAGDGHAMAWRAGAEFTAMERTQLRAGSFRYPVYGVGSPLHEWHPCTIVDAKGKEVPWFDRDGKPITTLAERTRPALGQKFFLAGGGAHATTRAQAHGSTAGAYQYRSPYIMPISELQDRIKRGEFTPPFYADLPSMPDAERRKIFGLSIAQEGKTLVPLYYTYTRGGFDPDKDMLQCDHMYGRGVGPPHWRASYGGGLVVDWNLNTNLDGLYAAGQMVATGTDHSNAATTGKYAGRKAAEYALKAAGPVIDSGQVQAEKVRVYAPVKRKSGIDWKELIAGLGRVMQEYCAVYKNEEIMKIGLRWVKELREGEAITVYARNPHELMRCLEAFSKITFAEMVLHASLARKASSSMLDFFRSDYPEVDAPEWHKWVTIKQVDGDVKVGELPLGYWRPLKENYEAHCGL